MDAEGITKISVITPNYNGERYLAQCIESVLAQRCDGVDLEYILVDGASTDGSVSVIDRYRGELAHFISEPDSGPANAINKGLALATGDVLAWLNADDFYHPDALRNVAEAVAAFPRRALYFGHCPIVGEDGAEIRRPITRFKEAFFPLSSRFTVQCVNFVSQPAMFFRRTAFNAVGPLREDLTAAWDYELILRLWRQGGAKWIKGGPLAAFRWHEGSISGGNFAQQFREEWQVAAADTGRFSLQALIHLGVRFGIVSIYNLMALRRRRRVCA